ncbi:MAG: tRNA (adenosine(37)-N6)-dimethylallyltransferase MiaA [Planctomycetes bacterium]|nr:tRNA (adenosine(37)-N6)-dimethylallyltransferase MiaA [Planctomycetota bacterium]
MPVQRDHSAPSPDAKFPVLVILGPTASGKSRMAMAVAERVRGEILSVDALKVYRGMDAGTAKPSITERKLIPHHGIDIVNPNEEFSVAEFLDYAEPLLADIVKRGNVPVLDVTAPYYLKALVYGIERGPGPNPQFRAAMDRMPAAELAAILLKDDPVAAQRIGPADKKRLVRALEMIKFGRKLPSEVKQWGQPRADYRWIFTGVRWPREILYERIRLRAQAMFDAGWLDEVQRILAAGGFSSTSGKAHGYKRIQEYLRGALTWQECVEQTVRDVKQFARKSMTFFKGFPKVQWLDVSSETEIDRASMYLAQEIKDMLKQCGHERPMVDLP